MTSDPSRPAPLDPSVSANQGSQPSFPKRFYKTVETKAHEKGFALTLDGRGARTPARSPLVVPTEALSRALADEWATVGDVIDPRTMPFTRFANSVIDGVAHNRSEVRAEIVRYAGSDLLVYRAGEPADLVAAQRRVWDPVIAWSQDALDAPIALGQGIVFVKQADATLQRLGTAVDTASGLGHAAPFRLAALHVMTTLTGSALLALAVAHGRLSTAEAWHSAHVDEDFQVSRWGQDEEASQRRAARWVDMETAGNLLTLTDAVRDVDRKESPNG